VHKNTCLCIETIGTAPFAPYAVSATQNITAQSSYQSCILIPATVPMIQSWTERKKERHTASQKDRPSRLSFPFPLPYRQNYYTFLLLPSYRQTISSFLSLFLFLHSLLFYSFFFWRTDRQTICFFFSLLVFRQIDRQENQGKKTTRYPFSLLVHHRGAWSLIPILKCLSSNISLGKSSKSNSPAASDGMGV